MIRSRKGYIISIISILLFLPIAGKYGSLSGQISGVVNSYTKVTSVGADFVIVDDPSAFATGDTVLIIQMKGIGVSTFYSAAVFGTENNYYGEPGIYEFLLVELVEPGPKKITFRNPLLGNYNPDSFVQLVKVKSYKEVDITGTLTCDPWDVSKGTGGIVAIIAQNKVNLSADIDVSGKGMRGGIPGLVDGNCASVSGDSLYYHVSSPYAGWKGEGLASQIEGGVLLDTLVFGKGKQYISTSGGGGNGTFAGGGGGGGFGYGGAGYKEQCSASGSGRGGLEIEYANLSGRVFLGSGGGSSGYTTGTAGAGGSGGGIVFILTDTLAGNGFSIIASGDSVSTITTGLAGAGGGGSAGSIVISSSTFGSTPLSLVADGGNGGHTTQGYGAGGGGCGGFIWTKIARPVNVMVSDTGGLGGRYFYPGLARGGSPGQSGIERNDLKMLLNGFLFNSIVSTVTSSQTDSICYNDFIPDLKGTDPVGGTSPYSFTWQRSYNGTTWNNLVPTGRDLIDHGQETDTVWFRRIVTDSKLPTALTDTSKAIKFLVQPLITDNLIGFNDTVCFGQDPVALVPANAGPGGGNGKYFYSWIDSTLVSPSWSVSGGVSNNPGYDPPALFEPTWYRRAVKSGRCYDTSAVTTVFVWPVIDHASNTISADQTICNDQLFADLTGSVPAGGAGVGSYSWEWESSIDNVNYILAEGVVNLQNYDPDEASTNFPGDQYYRRVVKSGYNDVCVDISDTVHLKNWPDITNNIISADQTICEGDIPLPMTGLDALGGDGTPLYQWQDSTRLTPSFSDIIGEAGKDYTPSLALSDTTWYRRIVLSSACNDTSNIIVVNVHPSILNNIAATIAGATDTTICDGQTPNLIIGSDPVGGTGTYGFNWKISTDNISYSPAPGTSDQKDYQPLSLTSTVWLYREVVSGECTTYSDTVNIIVLPPLSGNTISSPQTVCYNTVPQQLLGAMPAGGSGTYTYLWEESTDNLTWVPATGTNDTKDYQPPALTIPMYYRRTVYSGLSDCCQDISPSLMIGIYSLPTGTITVLKDTVCSGSPVSIDINLTGAAPWDLSISNGFGPIAINSVPTSPYTYNDNPVNTDTDPNKTFSYTFASITDNNGCVATSMTGTRTSVVYMNPTPDAGPTDEACGLTYTLQSNPSGSWGGRWSSFDAVLTSVADVNSSSNQVTVQDYGTWRFWWSETNWTCIDSASVDITFWEPPAPADAGPDSVLIPFEYDFQLLGAPAIVGTGTWSVKMSDGSPSFDDSNLSTSWVRNLTNGDNILTWTVVNGICPAETDDVKLAVSLIFIPEGFSPNGDPFNQTFNIEGLQFTENQLVITNLDGAVVYRADNYNNDWEGLDMGGSPLPDGTYYYYLTIKSPVPRKYNGYVIIKR